MTTRAHDEAEPTVRVSSGPVAPSKTAPAVAASAWALRLLTGPQAGKELSLSSGREYVFGRSGDVDIVLGEDLVSRRHARLSLTDTPSLADLGSTNGTFVNGERITKTFVRPDDRLLIGTTIARLVALDDTVVRAPPASLEQEAKTHSGTTMAGRLEEVPPVDLLQLFSNARKSGSLCLLPSSEGEGEVLLAAGRIAAARYDDRPWLTHRKALMRLLQVTQGAFEFRPFASGAPLPEVPPELQEPTELLLMDSMRLADELAALRPELPDDAAKLSVVRPLPGRLRMLEADALDLFQLALELETFSEIVDRSPLDDVAAVGGLLRLLSLGYLTVES